MELILPALPQGPEPIPWQTPDIQSRACFLPLIFNLPTPRRISHPSGCWETLAAERGCSLGAQVPPARARQAPAAAAQQPPGVKTEGSRVWILSI